MTSPAITYVTPQGVLWVCVDCMIKAVNDEEPTDPTPGEPTPWAREADTIVTFGSAGHDHEPTDDCDCDTIDFATSTCDGCGSRLAGTRHAFTWWA